jgi:major membrane immunogen (membrane-anchored lipoprotein)
MVKGTMKRGLVGLGVMLVLSGAVILGSDPLYKAIDSRSVSKEINSSSLALKDGSYKKESDYDEKGYKDVILMTVADGKITELEWDSLNKDGIGKSKLSLDGEYVMTEDGLTWSEQAKELADYVIKNQSLNGLEVNEDGKIDTIAGVSIDISGFYHMTEEIITEASK